MFHWIEARTFCYATEEEERVLAALRTVTPDIEPRRETREGYSGNSLIVLTARVEDAPTQRAVWARIVAALGKDEILRGIEDRLDEDGIYYLRFDKQSAYLGRIETATRPGGIPFQAAAAGVR